MPYMGHKNEPTSKCQQVIADESENHRKLRKQGNPFGLHPYL